MSESVVQSSSIVGHPDLSDDPASYPVETVDEVGKLIVNGLERLEVYRLEKVEIKWLEKN
jgi:hypothetical protein